jgi:hypothetical protein
MPLTFEGETGVTVRPDSSIYAMIGEHDQLALACGGRISRPWPCSQTAALHMASHLAMYADPGVRVTGLTGFLGKHRA